MTGVKTEYLLFSTKEDTIFPSVSTKEQNITR